jgi:hypothetical protein
MGIINAYDLPEKVVNPEVGGSDGPEGRSASSVLG